MTETNDNQYYYQPISPPPFQPLMPPAPGPRHHGHGLVVALSIVVVLALVGGGIGVWMLGKNSGKHQSGSLAGVGTMADSPTLPTSSTPTVTRAELNERACSKVYKILGRVGNTLELVVDGDTFNPRAARQLRAEGTRMYTIAATANGAVAQAIRHEATDTVDMATAMDNEDMYGVIHATKHATTAISEIQGVCNF